MAAVSATRSPREVQTGCRSGKLHERREGEHDPQAIQEIKASCSSRSPSRQQGGLARDGSRLPCTDRRARGICSSRVPPAVADPTGRRGLPSKRRPTVNRAEANPASRPPANPRARTPPRRPPMPVRRPTLPNPDDPLGLFGDGPPTWTINKGKLGERPSSSAREAIKQRDATALKLLWHANHVALSTGNRNADVARGIGTRRQTRGVCSAKSSVSERRVPSLHAGATTMVRPRHHARPAAVAPGP